MPSIKDIYHKMKGVKPLESYDLQGYEEVTKAINGIEQASFNILVADTGFGKSAFALNMIIDFALQGIPILYITTEMSEIKTLYRFLQCTLGVSYKKIKEFHNLIYKKQSAKRPFDYLSLTPEQQAAIDYQIAEDIRIGTETEKQLDSMTHALHLLMEYIHVEHKSDILEIKDSILAKINEKDIKICVIDHINDIQFGQTYPNHQDYNSDYMKTIGVMKVCKEIYKTPAEGGHSVPVIAVAQFKKGDNKGGLRMIDDIKGTSDLTQSASLVMYLYETDSQRKENDLEVARLKKVGGLENLRRTVTLQIMKSRDGGANSKFLLSFEAAKCNFKYIDQILPMT